MPSFIHRSRHVVGPIRSPHQWCAISWTSTGVEVVYSVIPSVIIVWVSMPDSESTKRNPSASKGYGPSFSSSQVSPRSASASPASASTRSSSPTGTQYDSGTPEEDTASLRAYSPVAMVTRYDDAGCSIDQRVVVTPSDSVREII